MDRKTTSVEVRPARESDRESVWEIFHAVVAAGDTFAFEPDISREATLAYWFAPGHRGYVAEANGKIVGAYILKPNHPGLGSHIANAAYMVFTEARGLGVGRKLGVHSLAEARRLGYRAMQFNLVISTNEAAVRLWRGLGFEVLATLPGAFRHATLGYVDAYIMWRSLDESMAELDE